MMRVIVDATPPHLYYFGGKSSLLPIFVRAQGTLAFFLIVFVFKSLERLLFFFFFPKDVISVPFLPSPPSFAPNIWIFAPCFYPLGR